LGFLFIGVPLVLAGFMPLIGKLSKRFLPDLLTNLALLFLLVYSLTFSRQILGSGSAIQQLSWLGEPINIILSLDGFSFFMLFTVSLVSLCVCLFSIDYMEHYGAKANYYALFLIMIVGMNGLILATDLFSIYLFLEVAAVASYGLVAYGRGHDELEATFKYLMLSAVASGFILLGIAILFGLTGSLDLSGISSGLTTLNNKMVVGFCSALFLMGFGLKAAVVPFHAWLPDAHPSAPAPISAMLSGLLIKVSGIYALTRIFFNVLGMNSALSTVLLYLGVISIVVGALLALGQNDIKRMLAYSSISQIGYILLGIGVGTPLGLIGALFHIFNHAIAKALLFLDSGSIERATGTRSLDKMGGLARRMPITAATSVIGSLAITGVPPLNGFWSKLIIIIALVEAKMYGFALIAILASVATLWYYLLIQRRVFFGKLNEIWKDVKEAPFWMTASTLILGLLCIATGIFFSIMIHSWLKPAVDILSTGTAHALSFIGL
jgi:multicomponent Na+:H+ antiporter subunit D